VIGGGDTGSDCVGTSIRQGAERVTQIEIMPKPPADRDEDNPWPYYAKTLKTSTSHEEGCERMWSLGTLKFIGMQRNVTHAKVEEVKWMKKDGRFVMESIPGSAKEIEADLILLAMGFTNPVYEGLLEQLKIELDPRKNISVDQQMATSSEKVFGTGDAVNGASLVVTAIASGRRTARKIDDYLKNTTLTTN